MEFMVYFLPIFKAVSVIFIIIVVSGVMIRKNILKREHISALSQITVILFLPCLIFSKIVLYFKPDQFPMWWVLPLVAGAMILLGIGITSLFYLGQHKKNRPYIAISAFMNANYMVLPIGEMAFSDQFDQFSAYTFLFVIGVIPMLWSIGKFMITSDSNSKFSFKSMFTPPFVASILGTVVVLSTLSRYIPDAVILPIDFLGKAAVPSATLVLGATIGTISLKRMPALVDIFKVLATKLFILPIITIFILLQTAIPYTHPLIADILVIQASVAPATQIIIQVKKYGGDVDKIGGMMLVSYAVCVLTIPTWFAVWNLLK